MSGACGWSGDVETFLATPEVVILRRLKRFTEQSGAPQLFAWDRSLGALRRELQNSMPEAAGCGLVLEYELPRSGGRRPDLIVLENGTVLVVEFKNRVYAEPADLDQVRNYARDLQDYHAECHNRKVIPVLVPVGMTGTPFEQDGVQVVPPAGLGALIRKLLKATPSGKVDTNDWVSASFDPLPSLVEAARLLFERQPLPRIKRAESARIPETVQLIEDAIRDARARKRRLLVLLTGVPGSGKTLVGLQLAHARNLGGPAVFLSGNGPLVQVLQFALGKRREFVQDLRSFLRDHLIRSETPPRERVVVFDEAQRAWDRDRVIANHKGDLSASEPELLVRIAGRVPDGFSIVALLGEGQHIHKGEEGGIEQWAEAARAAGGWQVLGPRHLAGPFEKAGLPYHPKELLNLTTTLRSHRARDVALWTGLLLDGRLDQARRVAEDLRASGFVLYGARRLDPLKKYLRDRYADDPAKRFGIIASSKFRNLDEYGLRPTGHRYWYYGQWYEAPPSDPRSGCGLKIVVSEFGCQGLELDMPLICWGADLSWDGSRWISRIGRFRPGYRNPHVLRLNAYRVLLTRGRDGLLVFVPRTDSRALDLTWEALLGAGIVPIPG